MDGNSGGGGEWRIGGKFETKRKADRERAKAFTIDRAQLLSYSDRNRFTSSGTTWMSFFFAVFDDRQSPPLPLVAIQIFLLIYSISLVTRDTVHVFKRNLEVFLHFIYIFSFFIDPILLSTFFLFLTLSFFNKHEQ